MPAVKFVVMNYAFFQVADCSWDQTVKVYWPQFSIQPGAPSLMTGAPPVEVAPPPPPAPHRQPAPYISSALRSKPPPTPPGAPPVPPR